VIDVRRALAVLVVCAVALSGCSAADPAAPEKVAVTSTTAAELRAAYNAMQAALLNKDLTGFQARIDLTRPAFRRCQLQEFDVAARLGYSPFPPVIAKVEPYLDTYVRAYLGDDRYGYERLYFRRDRGNWILTEPLESELGGDRMKTVSGLQLSYYGIDEDVVDTYAAAGNEARTFVLKQAEGHTATGEAFGLRIFPTRGAAGPGVGCDLGGFHLSNKPKDPYIRLFNSAIAFRFDLSLTESTIALVRHEALHWLQDQFVPGISARMPYWLTEGWPDYIGQSTDRATRRYVLCTTPTPTYKQLEDGVLVTSQTPPELWGQYYSFANTMVEYLYKTYGDNAYWDLMAAYRASAQSAANLPYVLGVTPEAFYSAWLAWAKKTYC
jgi:hypothetical protein